MSDNYVDHIVKPSLKRLFDIQIEESRYLINSFFANFISELYFSKENRQHKILDCNGFAHDRFTEFMLEPFLPSIGIYPGEHTIKQMEKATKALFEDLFVYFKDNTDEWHGEGKVFAKKNAIVC